MSGSVLSTVLTWDHENCCDISFNTKHTDKGESIASIFY